MNGFFDSTEATLIRSSTPLIPRCGACGLFRKCLSPKMSVSGKGKRKILILGEGPGRSEDEQGKPFVGASGELLDEVFGRAGLDWRTDTWITNSIICRSTTPDGKNRTPTDKELDYCKANLIKTINDLKPEIIIPLGGSAVKSLLGWLWKEDVGGINRWVGWRIPNQRLNCWIAPNWHPSHILRSEGDEQRKKGEDEVLRLLFEKHLRRAVKLKGRPWKKVPDYASQVQLIYSPEEAAAKIRSWIGERPIAFDFECEGLKPDNKELQIVSCSLSDGETAFAYPWHGDAIRATKEFLVSLTPKVGWNVKYEIRWAKAKLGITVKNWIWDGMLAAHVLDNRGGITGVEFQEFAVLGMSSHKEAIQPYLKSKGSNIKNRIRELSLDRLLHYNALDSLVEFKIAEKQMKLLGVNIL